MLWDGKNCKYAILKNIPTHVDVKQGDTIITGSYSNLFPEGILIGTVADVNNKKGDDFLNIKVLFSIDYRTITWVYVVNDLMKEEINKLRQSTEIE